MKSIRRGKTLGILALLAMTALSGCMAHRPHPYNRPSFHGSLDRAPAGFVSRAQFARWHQPVNEQLVATATANSSQELTLDGR